MQWTFSFCIWFIWCISEASFYCPEHTVCVSFSDPGRIYKSASVIDTVQSASRIFRINLYCTFLLWVRNTGKFLREIIFGSSKQMEDFSSEKLALLFYRYVSKWNKIFLIFFSKIFWYFYGTSCYCFPSKTNYIPHLFCKSL